MRNIVITITSDNSDVKTSTSELGIAGEKLQSQFIVDFSDQFVDGTATLEYQKASGDKGVVELEKSNKTYSAVVGEDLTAEQQEIKFQVKIVQATTNESTPIFKSKIFVLCVCESINASASVG